MCVNIIWLSRTCHVGNVRARSVAFGAPGTVWLWPSLWLGLRCRWRPLQALCLPSQLSDGLPTLCSAGAVEREGPFGRWDRRLGGQDMVLRSESAGTRPALSWEVVWCASRLCRRDAPARLIRFVTHPQGACHRLSYQPKSLSRSLVSFLS